MAVSVIGAGPTLPSIGSKTVTEGQTLTIPITLGTGPDNGTTDFLLDANASVSGVSKSTIGGNLATLTYASNTTATFAWTAPLVSANTVYQANISANDLNSTDFEVINITVTNNPVGPTTMWST